MEHYVRLVSSCLSSYGPGGKASAAYVLLSGDKNEDEL